MDLKFLLILLVLAIIYMSSDMLTNFFPFLLFKDSFCFNLRNVVNLSYNSVSREPILFYNRCFANKI